MIKWFTKCQNDFLKKYGIIARSRIHVYIKETFLPEKTNNTFTFTYEIAPIYRFQ